MGIKTAGIGFNTVDQKAGICIELGSTWIGASINVCSINCKYEH